MAASTLMILHSEISPTFTVVIRTPALVEGIALLGVTCKTVIVIGTSAGQTA